MALLLGLNKLLLPPSHTIARTSHNVRSLKRYLSKYVHPYGHIGIPAQACAVSAFHSQQDNCLLKKQLSRNCTMLQALAQFSDATIEEEKNLITTPKKEEEEEYDKLYRSVEVECRGIDKAVLKSYSKFVATTANHLQITLEKIEFPKHHIKRWTVLKSVFIYKKHRVQYEVRTYFLIMKFLRLTSSTADTFLEYIQRNLPEGVSMIVTKEELLPLPKFVKGSEKVAQPST